MQGFRSMGLRERIMKSNNSMLISKNQLISRLQGSKWRLITSRLNRCAKYAQLGQLTARFARVNCRLALRYIY